MCRNKSCYNGNEPHDDGPKPLYMRDWQLNLMRSVQTTFWGLI